VILNIRSWLRSQSSRRNRVETGLTQTRTRNRATTGPGHACTRNRVSQSDYRPLKGPRHTHAPKPTAQAKERPHEAQVRTLKSTGGKHFGQVSDMRAEETTKQTSKALKQRSLLAAAQRHVCNAQPFMCERGSCTCGSACGPGYCRKGANSRKHPHNHASVVKSGPVGSPDHVNAMAAKH
jgi:hypothetical protein